MRGGTTLTPVAEAGSAARRTVATTRAVPLTMQRTGEFDSTAQTLDKGPQNILFGDDANDAVWLTFDGESDAFLVLLAEQSSARTLLISFIEAVEETRLL